MKKILIILLCLIPFLATSQVVKIGNTTVNRGAKGDKGDMPSFTINGELVEDGDSITIEGTAQPNAYIVDELSDLQGDLSAHAGKQFIISADIDLGGSTINLPSNSILTFAGGKLSNGSLNSNNTTIITHPFENVFSVDLQLIGDTWNVTEIYPEWWGAIADNNTSTDNYQAIQNAFDFARNGGEVIIGGGGDYYVPVIDQETVTNNTGTLKIKHNGTVVKFMNNSFIAVTPNNYNRYTLLSVDTCDDVLLFSNRDGGLKGDFLGAKLSTPSEYGHLLVPSFRTTNLVVDGLEIKYAYGDGIKHRIHNGYITQISFEQGGINKTTGAIEVDSNRIRTSSFYDLTASTFHSGNDRYTDFQKFKELHVVGGAYGGFVGVKNGLVDLFFYDGSGNYLEVYENIEMYDRVRFPDEAERCYIVVNQSELTFQDNTDTTQPVQPIIRADEITLDMTIKNCHIHDSSRNNISITGAARTVIKNNLLHDAKGTLPMANIDIEDYHEGNKNTFIYGNTMYNGGNYDVVTVSSWNVKIEANKFLHKKPDGHLATITTQGYGVVVRNNHIEWGGVYVSDGGVFDSNESYYTRYYLNSGTIKNEYIKNGFISPREITTNPTTRTDGAKYIKNVVMFNTDDKLQKTTFNYSYFSEQTDQLIEIDGLKIIGELDDRSVIIRSDSEVVRNLETINNVDIYSPNVDGLIAPIVTIWYTPSDNEIVEFNDWNLTGADTNIRFRSSNQPLGHFKFNNLKINTERIGGSDRAIDVDNNLGSLTLRNSVIRDTTATSGTVINFDNTVTKFRMINSEVETGSGVNLLDIGTSTETSDWLYMNNIFTGVNLNNTTGTEIGNFEE